MEATSNAWMAEEQKLASLGSLGAKPSLTLLLRSSVDLPERFSFLQSSRSGLYE